MRYKPHHPKLNLALAVVCFLGGFLLFVLGLSDLESPRIWESLWGDLRTSTGDATMWGAFWMILGVVGIIYHIRFFRERRASSRQDLTSR